MKAGGGNGRETVLAIPFNRRRTSFGAIFPAAIALVGAAVAGTLTSLMIARLPAADPTRLMHPNPFAETWKSLHLLSSNVALLRASLGIAFFWLLASLANMNIDTFGNHELGLQQRDIGPLLGILVIGVALGSVLAGIWSRGRVELGIVPLGALGISLSAAVPLFDRREHRTRSGGDQVLTDGRAWRLLTLGLSGVVQRAGSNRFCSTAAKCGRGAWFWRRTISFRFRSCSFRGFCSGCCATY
jgi:hypothetical protein